MSLNVAVLGTGMAGFGAAYQLNQDGLRATMYDQHDHIGGHTASYTYPGGWTFDEGPHISFTEDPRIQNLFAGNIDGYETITARVNNYWQGYWIKHPAPVNLYGLPTDLVTRILLEFVERQNQPAPQIRNYEDWLRASYGDTFASTFPLNYTIKYHTTEAANMSTEWIGPRLYQPKLEEVFRGALAPATADVHYISHFRYPTEGGFVSYLKPFVRLADIRLNHKVVGIDPVGKVLRFANGTQASYDRLISSMPLPEIARIVDGVPADVCAAASRLACSELVIVNLGVDRADLMDAHWSYFYDRDICFSRLSAPHMQSPRNVPAGCGSLQAECYFSDKYRPLDRSPEQCIEPVIQDLRRAGVLKESDRILFQNTLHTRYANVIFDHEATPCSTLVKGWLRDVGIETCGRYGDWAYIWTDESFKSGEAAATRALAAR